MHKIQHPTNQLLIIACLMDECNRRNITHVRQIRLHGEADNRGPETWIGIEPQKVGSDSELSYIELPFIAMACKFLPLAPEMYFIVPTSYTESQPF